MGADAAGYIDLRGRTISNYCARHFYITDALLRGVDIYDIAQNAGTSVQYIESTYSKVTVDMKAEDITKNLGGHRMLRDERDIKMDLSP